MSQSVPSERHPYKSGQQRIAVPAVHLRAVTRTHVGHVRTANEDACLLLDLGAGESIGSAQLRRVEVGERGVLLAVADGMGGAKDGAVASSLAIETLERALRDTAGERPALAALEDAVRTSHAAVWDASVRAGHKGRSRMGTTLTAALVNGTRASIAHVGDSRAYLLRGGAMTQITRDQTMVQTLVDKGLMRPEDADGSPFRNVLLQAVGHQPEVDISVLELDLRDRDCLLICSDGLTTELSDREIRDTILMSMRLDVAAGRLIELANARGGRDNTTVVLAGVGMG